MTPTENFKINIAELKTAVKNKDKKIIIRLYHLFEATNLEEIPDELFNEYDKLITKANIILYQ